MRGSRHPSTERSSLARADAILAAFDGAHTTMSLPGIVARTGLPKTTVYRATEKMLELGWLEHEYDRYAIGRRLFEIAMLTQLRTNLCEEALPYMEDLYEATHETIHLAVLEEDHVLYVEKISGQPYEQFVKEKIQKPAGISRAFVSKGDRAYKIDEARRYLAGRSILLPPMNLPMAQAAGSWTASSVVALPSGSGSPTVWVT